MKVAIVGVVWLGASLALGMYSAPLLHAQTGETAADEAREAGNRPVAFVYVSSTNTYADQINAFSAAYNGKLTPVPGTPFAGNVYDMAVNGKYLFANGTDGFTISSFRIGSNGALTQVATLNTQTDPNTVGCPGLRSLELDHTGSTLYDSLYTGDVCDESSFHSFSIAKATGKLTDLGNPTPAETAFSGAIRFTGNNGFSYGASCNYYKTGNLSYILGFKRNPDGSLSQVLNSNAEPALTFPRFYCPLMTAADPANHVVIGMQEMDINNPFTPIGPPRLAIYTADGSGNLTTSSTAVNMTSTNTGTVADLRFSPAGKVLAIAGNGVELFHYYGTAHSMQYFTRVAPTETFNQVLWDNENHLYALAVQSEKLYVYTVTDHSVVPAPGSPFSIADPKYMIVQPGTAVPEI